MGYNLTFEKLIELLNRAAKASVKVATVIPIPGYLPRPPADRFPDAFLIDGEVLGVGDRVLVKDQPPGFENENGLYEYVQDLARCPEGTIPVPGSGLVRSLDADLTGEIVPGALIPVAKGTAKNSVYLLDHQGQDTPVIGVDNLVFVSSGIGSGLAGVLASGGNTGGNDIDVDDGDAIRFGESGGGPDSVGIESSNNPMTGSYTVRLPDSQGGANEVLTNDGSGNLSWQTRGGASPTLTFNAGENVTTGDTLVAEWDAGNAEVRVYLADANRPRWKVVGVATTTALTGNPVSVMAAMGQQVAATFGAAPAVGDNGSYAYLATVAGQVTVTAPSASGDAVVQVGIIVGADGVATAVDIVLQPNFVAQIA